MSTLIKSALILDSSSSYHKQKKDILINNQGVIEQIDDAIVVSKTVTNVVEKDNLYVSNGWFDSSISLGEPGFEERETLEHGLKVAAKSGFTGVAVNPNTFPVVDNKAAVEFLINKDKYQATKIYPIGALTQQSKGEELAELFDMYQSGAIAFGDYSKPIVNDNLLKIALLYAQNFDGLVLSFPKNISIAGDGLVNEGINSTTLGLKGIPALAEHIQISRDLFLLEYTGGKLHIPTISTKKSVALIKEAKNKGLKVTCSVAAHHLLLTDDELNEFDTNYKVTPPLRTKEDCQALIQGVMDGSIDCITSDHNPIDIEYKKVEFSVAKNGTIGMESLFGVVNSILPIDKSIECLTSKSKQIFGVHQTSIEVGNQADLTFFNPELEYVFDHKDIFSTSKNSAFLGKKLKGKALGVFSNNQLIFEE